MNWLLIDYVLVSFISSRFWQYVVSKGGEIKLLNSKFVKPFLEHILLQSGLKMISDSEPPYWNIPFKAENSLVLPDSFHLYKNPTLPPKKI